MDGKQQKLKIFLCKLHLSSGGSIQVNYGFAVMGDMMIGVLKSFTVKLCSSEISAFLGSSLVYFLKDQIALLM